LVYRARRLSAPVRYAFAGVLMVSVFIARLTVLAPFLPPGFPFLISFGAVLFISSLFKSGPGVFATMLATALSLYYVIPPIGSFAADDPAQYFGAALFVAVASLMTTTISELHDAVDRAKAATERSQAAEEHRALLLREFRHRTRNDLQSIVSLLNLRARSATGGEQKGLKAAAAHCIGLGRVHSHLMSATPGFGEEAVVDCRDFVCGLVRDFKASVHNTHPWLVIHSDSESYPISCERAVQLGLVLNECLVNAVRYAFPEGGEGYGERMGQISVHFNRQDSSFVLTVRDDGDGMEVDPGGLRSRLLKALSRQLRGEFERGPGPDGIGTRCELRFPFEAPTLLPMPTQPQLAPARVTQPETRRLPITGKRQEKEGLPQRGILL
jgi:two-component sensor histidine kinase